MMISNAHSCVFLHVPKTGGTSMKQALRRACRDAMLWPEDYGKTDNGWWHVRATTVRNCIGEERWGRYFKFAFVRNPWDRLVSLYNMLIEHCLCDSDFASFAETTKEKNQIDYFSDAAGNRMIDFVGRFEQLESDFDYVCRRVGVAANLRHSNAAATPVNYRDYYTPELRQLVAERFARDIQTFGYEF